MSAYKHAAGGMVERLADHAFIPPDPQNADYRRYLVDVKAGAEVLPADPPPEPEPTRDARIRAAVREGKAEIKAAGLDGKTAAVLTAVLDKLGAALGENA